MLFCGPRASIRSEFIVCALCLCIIIFPDYCLAGPGFKESLFAVSINGSRVSDGTLLLIADLPSDDDIKRQEFYLSGEDLKSWRLRIHTAVEGIEYDNHIFYPASSMKGVKVTLSQPDQSIDLEVPNAAFESTVLDFRRSTALRPQTTTGLFLNHDLSFEGGDGLEDGLDGLFEIVLFSPYGVLLNSFSGQDIGKQTSAVRLESTYQFDDVDNKWSYRVGDSISRGGVMGRPSRFGGVQWATNFGVQPGFITYPSVSAIGGLADLPSVFDLYVNNVKTLSREVDTGPFELYNIPAVSGSGDIMIVVKDLLGREQIISQSYYAAPQLLKKGLSDFSYEAGYERLDYGEESNDYGKFAAIGTHRYGLSETLTGELHLEGTADQQMSSLAFAGLFPAIGVLSAGIAGSDGDEGAGWQWLIGHEYQSNRFNMGGSFRMADRDFRSLGEADPFKHQVQLHGNVFLGRYGGIGLSYAEQEYFEQERARIISGHYGVKAGPGQFNVTGFKDAGAGDSYGVNIYYVMTLGERSSASAGVNMQSNERRDGIEIQQSFPSSDMGYAWRLRGEKGDDGSGMIQGNVTRHGKTNSISLDVTSQDESEYYRAGLSGGFTFMKEGFFMSRRINQSFALVSTSGVPDVAVYEQNRKTGITNSKGYLLVPNLMPYENNTLKLNAEDLPIDVELTGNAAEDTVPYFRSGVVIPFNVRMSKSVIIRIKTPDGKFVPAGTKIFNSDGDREWTAAKKGEVFLNDVSEGTLALAAHINGELFGIVINIPEIKSDIPELGDFIFNRLAEGSGDSEKVVPARE